MREADRNRQTKLKERELGWIQYHSNHAGLVEHEEDLEEDARDAVVAGR